jgi:tetratricopeptide (TPR) repeat protein
VSGVLILVIKGRAMKSKTYRIGQLASVSLALLVLAGCSVSGVNTVSVEDRSINGASSVKTQDSNAQVTALNVRPSFKASDNVNDQLEKPLDEQLKAPEVAVTEQSPATVALLNTANYQTSNGSLRAAQSSLERALRISPKDPEVYQSLGEVHRRLGEYVQAEQMTLKGIALASGQSSKLRRLWSALAKIRSESGDAAGANIAFKKSQSY